MLIFLLLSPFVIAIPEPRAASWSTKTFGPDGPWNAVEVTIGASKQKIALYPGHAFHSVIISTDYCRLNTTFSHCDAGNYSTANADFSEGPILFRTLAQEWMTGVPVAGNGTHMLLDKIDLGFKDDNTDITTDASFAVITDSDQMLTLPDGTHYPGFVGCLSLGAPTPNQTFAQILGVPLSSSIIPWDLSQRGTTASASFGLHLGCGISSARVPGSLLWGGYDRNRIAGPVTTLDGDFNTPLLLKDIAITTIKGASPFSLPSGPKSKSIPGLLAKGNSSLAASPGLPVIIDPCSPYLSLPKSTCDAIASFLPVTYSPSLGLYLWDVSSPRTLIIPTSASALSFTFTSLTPKTNQKDFTIHIPFPHLSLTLSPPLSPPSTNGLPTLYFPCSTSSGTGSSVLGRAFLQDTFLAANWEAKKTFLAQAPGPGVQKAGVDAVGIDRRDASLQGGGGEKEWIASWEGFWNVLSEGQANGTEGVLGGSGKEDGGGDGGLSTGAKAGIGVGVGIVLGVVAVCGVGGVWWWRRLKKNKVIDKEVVTSGGGPWWSGGKRDSSDGGRPAEVAGTSVKDLMNMPVEVDGFQVDKRRTLAEMDGSGRKSLGRYGRHRSKLPIYELA